MDAPQELVEVKKQMIQTLGTVERKLLLEYLDRVYGYLEITTNKYIFYFEDLYTFHLSGFRHHQQGTWS